jgi:hypothetical protein
LTFNEFQDGRPKCSRPHLMDGRNSMNSPSERARLHELIDSLAENDIPTAARVLEALRGGGPSLPDLLANASEDDEPETEEERVAVAEARDELRRGEAIEHDEAMRRLRPA